MNNGPLTVFGSGRIQQVDTSGALGKPLIECGGRCSLIRSASWTSDGTRLAFVAECTASCASEGDPYHGIRVFDVRTGDDRLIAPGDDFGLVDWSPDGTRIAFTDRNGSFLSIMNADGSNVREIPVMKEGIASIESIAWSPDGTSIAYSTFPDGQMYVETIDGSSQEALGPGREPDWSPDGARIAYASLDRCQIWTMSPDGSQRTKVAQVTHPHQSACAPKSLVLPEQRTHHGVSGFATLENVAWQPGPAWSPNGRMIGFNADRGLFTVKRNGSDLRRVPGADYEAVAWQPVR
jgi:Tol biopolymer transport system component